MPENRVKQEFRRVGIAPKVTRADGQKPVISGYAAVFWDPNDVGSEYSLYSDIVERIRPGAFDRAVREDDVRGLYNHEECEVLGRTKSGTLRLSVDLKGLRYEIDPPDTETGNDVVTLLERGDIDGSSFQFEATRVTWEEFKANPDAPTKYVRWIEEVKLYDVGPVTFPAYTSATSGVRSKESEESIRGEFDTWKRGENQSEAAVDLDQIEIALKKMEFDETDG
jgi:uncharacterized protein